MTDERLGEDLWRAIAHLPRGSGIVFRHYATPVAERRALFRRVVRMARVRGLILVRAGERCGFGEMGVHGSGRRTGAQSASIRRPGLDQGPVVPQSGLTGKLRHLSRQHYLAIHPGGLRTMPAHSRGEAMAAIRQGADAIFVSPVFATDSHPGAPALGVRGAYRIAQGLPVRAIALGGMNARRFRGMRGFYGWAAIGAWV